MIQLAQGIAALLPQGRGVVVGLIADRRALGLSGRGWIDRVVADRDRQIVVGEPTFRRQGRLAATAGGGDPLAPFGVGYVTGSKYPLDTGFGPAGAHLQVALAIELDLAGHQARIGGVADRIEEAFHGQGLLLATGRVAQLDRFEPVATGDIDQILVPMHADGGVGQHPIGHGPAGPQGIAAHDQMDLAAVFGEIDRLLTG